jgi:hypothetical protein
MARSASGGALALLLAVAGARAGEPPARRPDPVRLLYDRGPGTERCPEPDELRAAVAARLGYEPFREDAATVVAAAVSLRGRVLRAQIELRAASGEVVGAREIESPENDCSELASAVALAISIAIDPRSATRPIPTAPASRAAASPAAVAKAPGPGARPAERTAPVPAAKPAEPVRFRGGLDALAAFGAAPKPAFGALLFAGIRWRALSVGIEGRADLPAGTRAPGGSQVSAMLLAGTLAPCVHWWATMACGLVSVGALQSTNEGAAGSKQTTTPFVAAGGRFGVEVAIVSTLSARGHVDLLGAATRTILAVDGITAWRTPPLGGALGAGLLWSFP